MSSTFTRISAMQLVINSISLMFPALVIAQSADIPVESEDATAASVESTDSNAEEDGGENSSPEPPTPGTSAVTGQHAAEALNALIEHFTSAPSVEVLPAPDFSGLDQKLIAGFEDSLRSGQLNRLAYRVMPASRGEHVLMESDGLRIDMAPGPDVRRGVGVWFENPVVGDFRVTARYELLATDTPALSGDANLRLWTHREDRAAVYFAVVDQPAEVGFWTNVGRTEDGQQRIAGNFHAGKAKSGRLRVVRQQGQVYYLTAPGDSEEFRLLQTREFPADDIVGIRIGGRSDNETAALSMRWSDLVIEAEEIRDLPTAPADGAVSSSGNSDAEPFVEPPAAEPDPADVSHLRSGFEHDFVASSFDKENLELVGRDVDQHTQSTDGGLQIQLPQDTPTARWVGFAPLFAVQGDFEVTIDYSAETRPPLDSSPEGGQSGLRLQVRAALQSDPRQALLCAVTRQRDGTFHASGMRANIIDGKPNRKGCPAVIVNESGRLRLIRSQGTMHFLTAEADSDRFEERFRIECGDEPVDSLKITANVGAGTSDDTIEIKRFTIRAEGLPGCTRIVTPAGSSRWLLAGGVGTVIIAAGGGIWFWRRS